MLYSDALSHKANFKVTDENKQEEEASAKGKLEKSRGTRQGETGKWKRTEGTGAESGGGCARTQWVGGALWESSPLTRTEATLCRR